MRLWCAKLTKIPEPTAPALYVIEHIPAEAKPQPAPPKLPFSNHTPKPHRPTGPAERMPFRINDSQSIFALSVLEAVAEGEAVGAGEGALGEGVADGYEVEGAIAGVGEVAAPEPHAPMVGFEAQAGAEGGVEILP